MLRCPPPKFIRLALMASLAISLATCLVPQQGTAGLRDQLGRVTRALGKTAELTGNAGKWAEEATAVVKAAKLTGNAGKWAEEAAALVGAGKLTDAAYRYDDLAITAREAKTPAGEKVALKCEQVAQALRREEGLNRLPPEQRAVIKSLEEVSVPVSGIAFVSIKVKSFAQRFFRGAQEPKEYLHADGVNKEFVTTWEKTPLEKRIFMVGSRNNAEQIRGVISQLARDGFQVFFYLFCAEIPGKLCPDETVGAFFATAGLAVVFDTSDAAASPFVRLELKTAQRVRNGQPLIFMITPQPVLDALQAGLDALQAGLDALPDRLDALPVKQSIQAGATLPGQLSRQAVAIYTDERP
jgi:hypothetical protein